MPLIQSSVLRVRGTRTGAQLIAASEINSRALTAFPAALVSGLETPEKACVSGLSGDSRAEVSGDSMCSFMPAPPEPARESGDIPAQFVLPVVRLSSSLSPRQWPRTTLLGLLAQEYEPAS